MGRMYMIKITIPFRLHLNLLAMHSCKYRKYGGLGFSILNNGNYLVAEEDVDNKIIIKGECNNSLRIQKIENILNDIKEKYKLKKPIKIELHGHYYFHIGLGVGTAVTLACIEALFLYNNMSVDHNKIIEESKRGGTSGIGINTYFSGGFVIDIGIKSDNIEHLPSSQKSTLSISNVLARCDFPNWEFGIILPKKRNEISDINEVAFFKSTCPIPDSEAYFASYLAIFGTFSSIKESNYELFCSSINETQNTFWKKSEINQNNSNINLINYLNSLKVDCAGMSSFGNSIYFFSRNIGGIESCLDKDNYNLMTFSACNTGRDIEYV